MPDGRSVPARHHSKGFLVTTGIETAPTTVTLTPPPDVPRRLVPGPIAAPRALVAAIVAGVAFDRLPSGGVGYGVALLLIVLPVLLVLSGGAQRRWARLQLFPILVIAPWIALRANGTTQLLDVATCVGLLVLSATSGPLASSTKPSPDPALIRVGYGAASILDAPRYAGAGIKHIVAGRGDTAKGLVRGVMYALPVAMIVIPLLASADASFASIFEVGDARAIVRHSMLAVGGAILFAGLVRSAVTPRSPYAWWMPRLGRVEAIAILGLFAMIYAGFVAARLLDPGNRERDPRLLADQARAGFFQLVAVVAITVAVLWVVRTATGRGIGRSGRWRSPSSR